MELDLRGESDLVFSMAVAAESALVSERTSFVIDGTSYDAREIVDRHGTRLHEFAAGPGKMTVEYSATVDGRAEAHLERRRGQADAHLEGSGRRIGCLLYTSDAADE